MVEQKKYIVYYLDVAMELGAEARSLQSIGWDDLSFGSGCELNEFATRLELLRATVQMVVELQEYGGADGLSVAELVCEEQPDIASKYEFWELKALATMLLGADLPRVSEAFQSLFREFNVTYFGGSLLEYKVRVVLDLHTVANEPVFEGSVSSGLIRFRERCIYIRYSGQTSMEQILIHEMAHAATGGGHGQRWLTEMVRLKGAGAPVPDWELEP